MGFANVKSLTTFIKGIVTSCTIILASACATTENVTPTPEPIQKTHFVLRNGERMDNLAPMPSMGAVWLDWYAGEKRVESYLAYRVWDVNGDGRVDMLDILDESGNLAARAYDFNFDGAIDDVAYGSDIIHD